MQKILPFAEFFLYSKIRYTYAKNLIASKGVSLGLKLMCTNVKKLN